MSQSATAAIKEWRTLLGERAITSAAELTAAETATFATQAKISCILRARNRAEVVQVLAVANKHKVPIHPMSTGKNWAYGSRVPTAGGSALLDLSLMNRILEFDEAKGFVTVEPGVTQTQLWKFLQTNCKSQRLWIDATASSPVASLIANYSERGHGLTPYCDHVATACGLEVVLPSGDTINTGFGAFKDSKNRPIDSWGVGPSLDGLFSQSNLGIITRMTLWLYPEPEVSLLCSFSFPDEEKFLSSIDAMAKLRLDGTLKCGPQFASMYFVLSRTGRFPWDQAPDGYLTHDKAMALAKAAGIPPWSGSIGLFGSKAQVAADLERIKSALHSAGKITVFDQEAISAELEHGNPRAPDLANLFRQMTGGLGGIGLARAYWKNRGASAGDAAAADLDADRCGIIAHCATVPFSEADLRAGLKIAATTATGLRFEPVTSVYSPRPRLMQVHTFICFDRSTPGMDKAALHCHAELTRAFAASGYHAHRLNPVAMDAMSEMDPTYLQVLRKIKMALDPNGILAPGRYLPLE